MTAPTVAQLAGRLVIHPGVAVPGSLLSSRQDWAAQLSANQPVSAVPGLMAGLFSLCGNAHRVCAGLAIGAAEGRRENSAGIGERLRLETAQEHVRRIGLDWPRLLAPRPSEQAVQAPALDALAACPLLRTISPVDWDAARDWLQQHLLHMDPVAWLSAWLGGAGNWLAAWCERQDAWLPNLLRPAQLVDAADQPLSAKHALQPHGAREHLKTLSAALALKPGFAMAPTWHGAIAHSGSWARQQTPHDQPALSPWALFGSRLAELVRLCLPEGGSWLRWGSLSTGAVQGLGWVEMARGLLLHQVTLTTDGVRVQHCRVIAPTEWNFHPQGEVARRLSALDPGAPDVWQRVNLLMAAFDPCVPFEVMSRDASEVQHA
jgi:hypothetical protein